MGSSLQVRVPFWGVLLNKGCRLYDGDPKGDPNLGDCPSKGGFSGVGVRRGRGLRGMRRFELGVGCVVGFRV